MDEPGISWPAWKFGMKRDDLFTKLHDQFNTIALPIQDPEAFHHDVYEISTTASTTEEFHRLLADRKELRLRELNESLESASVEIIANPTLIGTQQWQHALQLFRTRSFDSLVRYFASYLPDGHPWQQDTTTDPTYKTFFDDLDDDDDHLAIMTHEPFSMDPSSSIPASHLPPSPRSLTMCSENSNPSTPERSLSFSETESDILVLSTTLLRDFDDGASQPDEPDTPITSISDISEAHYPESQPDVHACDEVDATSEVHLSVEEESTNAKTPTTCRDDLSSDSYLDHTPSDLSQPTGSPKSKYTPLQQHVRDVSPGLLSRGRRRSPEVGRIQKSQQDPTRARPKGRRR
ncbi:hypothetical protein F5X96DRAFT_364144 [Biscogniauxia mediterranea]|nr:hypothetical protein F5X96DRAFT_364144 [Biscogniauxia mediterranea]